MTTTMDAKTIIAFFACIMLLSLSACIAQNVQTQIPKEEPSEDSKDIKGLRTVIQTRAGDLSLGYADGKVTLQGTLQRSTPCVNWQIDAIVMESFPEQVQFSIMDKSTAEMCVQVLGKPQDVYAEAQVSEQSKITVLFKEETVFDGQLE